MGKQIHLARKSGQPLYTQLAEELSREIAGLPEGSKFHSEKDSCLRLNVCEALIFEEEAPGMGNPKAMATQLKKIIKH